MEDQASGGPVFIVGAPRSGTSILYRTLLKHPSFRVEGDPALQLAESAILDTLHTAPRWKPPKPPRLWLFFLQDEKGYAGFLGEVGAITAGLDPVPAGERPPWTGPILESFVRHASSTRSCHRLLEKTPTHIDRAEWLLESLPTARVLFIRRHPVDTYSSYLRRARSDPKADWADLSVEEFAAVYLRHAERAEILAAAHPARFSIVAYEDFTAAPAEEVGRLCRWLDEEFHPAMVEEAEPDLTRSANDPHLFGRITTETKDWGRYLDAATAREVERLTADVARRWGYAPRTV